MVCRSCSSRVTAAEKECSASCVERSTCSGLEASGKYSIQREASVAANSTVSGMKLVSRRDGTGERLRPNLAVEALEASGMLDAQGLGVSHGAREVAVFYATDVDSLDSRTRT